MTNQPNFLFIMSDDHAAHAISAYGSKINTTPNIDRIADGGCGSIPASARIRSVRRAGPRSSPAPTTT